MVLRVLLQRQISLLSQKKANRQILGKEEEIFAPLCKPLPTLRRVLQSQDKEEEVKHPRTSRLQHGRDAQKGDGRGTCPQRQGGGRGGGKTPKVIRQGEACCSSAATAQMKSMSGDEGAQLAHRGRGPPHVWGQM